MTARRLLAAAALIIAMAVPAFAQAGAEALAVLESQMKGDAAIVVKLDDGQTHEGRLDRAVPGRISLRSAAGAVDIDAAKILEIHKRGDSLKNGALWGLAVAAPVAAWLGWFAHTLCFNESGTNCDGAAVVAALPLAGGLAAGSLIDSLHRGTTLVYRKGNLVTLAPVIGRGKYGVGGQLAFGARGGR